MSPIGQQLVYNNDKKYYINTDEYNNSNRRSQNDERIFEYRYNNRYKPNQINNKRYNYIEDNKYSENEYSIRSPNRLSQNNINREKYSPNPMYKSMKVYGNNYNNDLNNYGESRRNNYESNNYYNGNRIKQAVNDNYY